jgi:hypothetical protein
MAADFAQGRPILSQAARNGIDAAQAEADLLAEAGGRHSGSRLEQMVTQHVEHNSPAGISFASQRDFAENWAIRTAEQGTRPYLIRIEVPVPNAGVRQTGASYLSEYETTFLHQAEYQSAGLYEITSWQTGPRSKNGGRYQWATTYNPVTPAAGGGAPIVVTPAPAPATVEASGLGAAPLALLDEALDLWRQVSGGALPMQVRLAVADLEPGELAHAWITQLDAVGGPSEGKIVLDWNGDGRGWFVDATPLDASELGDVTSAAFGRYDLFSVLAHELGHTLGFLRGYDGYDQHVVVAPDGSLSFQSATVRVSLSPDGSHLTDSVHASDLMSDSLGLFER